MPTLMLVPTGIGCDIGAPMSQPMPVGTSISVGIGAELTR